MSTIAFSREAELIGSFDVVVCGGGPGGVMAAVAAARSGAKVAIIERYGFFGGMATAGLVAPISVFNYNGQRIVDGLPWEFVERLIAVGGAREEKPLGNITFSPEKYKLVAQRMLHESGVKMLLHSYVAGIEMDADKCLTHAVFVNKSGLQAVEGKVFVDATGDADIASMAGVPMQPKSDALQPTSLIFMMAGVDTDNLPMIRHAKQGVNYHDLTMRSILEGLDEELPQFGGPWYCGVLVPGVVLINMTRRAADMTDNAQATETELVLHEQACQFSEVLCKHVPQFANASLLATAPQTGVRETRRVVGLHTLTGEEYINAVNFPDAISRGCHPVDIHAAAGTKQRCQFLKSAAYVPYRSLVMAGYPNLIMAGRSLSADAVASASIRVQASVMGLGQAAGAAAAQSLSEGCPIQQIDTARLRDTLKRWGANLD